MQAQVLQRRAFQTGRLVQRAVVQLRRRRLQRPVQFAQVLDPADRRNLRPAQSRFHPERMAMQALVGAAFGALGQEMGGVKGGRALGSTDPTSANIADPGWSANRAIYVEDITATIYSALGVDWTKSINDTPSGRRFDYLVQSAELNFRPVEEVFG